MEQLIFKSKKRLTPKQIKMAVRVLNAIGLEVESVENNIKNSEWIPTKEELEQIEKAKQSAREGKINRLTAEKRKELFG